MIDHTNTLTLATGLVQYAPIGILLLIAIGFGVINLVGSTILGPSRTGPVKESVYETGMNPIGSARKRFNVRFYLLAMAFLVFDVEIVFLYPWATVFPNLKYADPLGLQFLFRMMFFIGTSVIAFLYAWRKRVFAFD